MRLSLKNKNFWLLILFYGLYLVGISLLIRVFQLVFDFPPITIPLKDSLWAIWGYGWDGWHFLSIATTGYAFPNQAFFPFYPLLVRGLDLGLPLSISYRVNLLLLPLLFILLLKLTDVMEIPLTSRISAILVFLLFPTAFFLQANYSETFFILLSLGSLLLLLRRRFWGAALLCGLATGVRINGLVLGVVIILSYLLAKRQEKSSIFVTLVKTVPLGVVCCLGVVSYFLYLQVAFGSWEIFFKAHHEWFRSVGSVGTAISVVTNNLALAVPTAFDLFFNPPLSIFERKQAIRGFFESVFLVAGLGLLVFSFRKIKWELYLFSFLNFLLPLSSGSTMSLGRSLLLMYPLIIYFGARLSPNFWLPLYVFVATLLQLVFIMLFVNNVFIA